MTGIVNSTGARSGIIGTTVGTPAVAAGFDDADSWVITIAADGNYPSQGIINFAGAEKQGGNHGYDAGTVTIGTAGWYYLHFHLTQKGRTTTTMDAIFRLNGSDLLQGGRVYGYTNPIAGSLSSPFTAPASPSHMDKSCSIIYEFSVSETIQVFGSGYFDGTEVDPMSSFTGFRLGS